MRIMIVGALLIALAGGEAHAQSRDDVWKDPWGVSPRADGPGLCVWMPIGKRKGTDQLEYADALFSAAAILGAEEGSKPAVVISFYGAWLEALQRGGWTVTEEAKLSAGGKPLAAVPNPLATPARQALAFEALPEGCDAFELTIPQEGGALVLRFRRLSRRIKEAEPHVQAWIEHATSDRLRPVSAIGPYLDCDGYRAFAEADPEVRATLCIRELALGFREGKGLPRFLAWKGLQETSWGQANVKGIAGDERGVKQALALWTLRGVPGVPAENPGPTR